MGALKIRLQRNEFEWKRKIERVSNPCLCQDAQLVDQLCTTNKVIFLLRCFSLLVYKSNEILTYNKDGGKKDLLTRTNDTRNDFRTLRKVTRVRFLASPCGQYFPMTALLRGEGSGLMLMVVIGPYLVLLDSTITKNSRSNEFDFLWDSITVRHRSLKKFFKGFISAQK